MSSAAESRRQKARQKQKYRRESAQQSRRQRTQRAKAGIAEASRWPVSECWISQDWYEWGARVHALIARRHANGTHAWAAFEVDLADDGLVAVETQVGVPEGAVQAQLVKRSESGALMATQAPELVRLVNEGLAFRRERGLPDPKGLDDALAFLDDQDDEGATFEYLFGHEEENEVTEEVPARMSLWSKFRGMFGG